MKKISITFFTIVILLVINAFGISNSNNNVNTVIATNERIDFDYNNLEIGTVLIDNGNITISENGYSQNRSIY